jgi:hypothetical protein
MQKNNKKEDMPTFGMSSTIRSVRQGDNPSCNAPLILASTRPASVSRSIDFYYLNRDGVPLEQNRLLFMNFP